MKKFLSLSLSFLIAFLGCPLSALASAEVFTPPIFVKTLDLQRQVQQLKEDVLNQERANHDEEIATGALAQQNADAIQKLRSSDLFTNIDTMRELQETMDHYNRQLDEHNRLLTAHNEETKALRARIEKLEHLFDPVIYLNKDVEFMKSSSDLAGYLQEQKDFLMSQNRSLVEKNQQLKDFKDQLISTKEELQSVDRTTITEEHLKSQIKRLKEYQRSLQEKDNRLTALENQILKKDEQIAQLKSQLTLAIQQLSKAQQDLAIKDKTIQQQKEALDDLHQDIGQIQQNVSNLKNKYVLTKDGFKQVRTKIMTLQDQLSQANVRAKEAGIQDKELIQLKGDLAALSYQAQIGKEDLNDYQVQVQKLNMTVDGLTAQMNTKDKDLQEKTRQINELKEQLKKTAGVKDMVKKVQTHLSDLTGQVDHLKTDVGGLLRFKERFRLSLELISKYHTLEQLAAQKCALLFQLVDKRQERVEYFRGQLKETIVYWQHLNQGNEDQIAHLKNDIEQKQGQIEQLQQQNQAKEKNSAQLESMLDVYQKRIDDKDGNIKDRALEITKLQADLQTAQSNFEQNQKDLKKVKDYFFELEKKFTDRGKDLREKIQESALLSVTSDQQKQELSVLKQKVSVLQERLTVAEEKLKTSVDQGELDKVKQMLKAYSNELSLLKISLNGKDDQIRSLENQITPNIRLQKELEAAKNKISKLMEDVYFKEKEIERLKLKVSSKLSK